MHLTLYLALTPLQGEASFHGIIIFSQSTGKTLEFGYSLFVYPIEPGIQAFAFRSRSMVVNSWISSLASLIS